MAERIRRTPNDPAVIEALSSPKVADFLMTVYVFEGKRKNPEDEEPKAGFIVTVNSPETQLPGTISRGEKDILIVGPFSGLPSIVQNESVIRVDWCDKELLELVQSAEGDEVVLRNPNPGPEGDEWDSPAYSSFWNGAERYLNKKAQTLQKIGKRVRIV